MSILKSLILECLVTSDNRKYIQTRNYKTYSINKERMKVILLLAFTLHGNILEPHKQY